MLFIESFGDRLSTPERVLLDASMLMIIVFPTLYFLVFKEMKEQIRLRREAEQTQNAWNKTLEVMVEERTERLQKANEDLLVEVQERAKAALAMRTALNEARRGKDRLDAILNAVNDALVVVDNEWQVLAANQAAEIMFNTSSYDLHGKSLKNFLLPWSEGPSDLDQFFSRERDEYPTFLVPPESFSGERSPVQMRFGEDLEWDEQPATVVTFYYRSDLAEQIHKKAPLS